MVVNVLNLLMDTSKCFLELMVFEKVHKFYSKSEQERKDSIPRFALFRKILFAVLVNNYE